MPCGKEISHVALQTGVLLCFAWGKALTSFSMGARVYLALVPCETMAWQQLPANGCPRGEELSLCT